MEQMPKASRISRANLIGECKNLLVTIRLLVGLHSMMMLQYDTEGHIDSPVAKHFEQELYDLEQECTQYVDMLVTEEPPF